MCCEAIVVSTLAGFLFVPRKPGDTVTASGRKELSVVKNTCFTHPFPGGLRRIEERQLVGLTGNAVVTVSTAAPVTTRAKRAATAAAPYEKLRVCIAAGIRFVLYVGAALPWRASAAFVCVCFLISALYAERSHFTGDDNLEC